MDSDLLLALFQAAQTPTAPPAAANGWLTMQISIGDLGIFGTVIAAYVAIRERLARLETQVKPMWDAWNLRRGDRRDG